MKNQLEVFKTTASQFASAKATAKEVKSLGNQLIGQAFYILQSGSIQDKVALQRYVAKEGEGNAYKAHVSKARTIVEHFAGADVAVMKDGSEVTADMLKAGSFDNLPAITFSSVYSAIKADAKEENASESRAKQALAKGLEVAGISKEDAKALTSADLAIYQQQGEAILAAEDAEAAKETREETLARVLLLISSNGLEGDVIAALNTASQVQAA